MSDINTPSHANELTALRPAQRAQLDVIMANLRDQLPVIAAGAIITKTLIKEVEAVLLKNMAEIISASLVAAGLSVVIPALTMAVVNAVGFTAGGVAAGSMAAAFQSAVYGGLTGGVFSTLQSFGATAVMASPVAIAVAGVAVLGGGGYFAYRTFKSREMSTTPPDTDADTKERQDDNREDPETQRGTAWSAPDSDTDTERASRPSSTPTSTAGAGAMVVKKPTTDMYHHMVSTGYFPVTAGTIGNSASEHLQATGNGASSAFSTAERQEIDKRLRMLF